MNVTFWKPIMFPMNSMNSQYCCLSISKNLEKAKKINKDKSENEFSVRGRC